MIPAFVGVAVKRATPWAFVRTTAILPAAANLTATPRTGLFERVTLATTSCDEPLALTIFGVTFSTRQMSTGFGLGLGVGLGFGLGVGGVTGAVTSVDAHSVLLAPF